MEKAVFVYFAWQQDASFPLEPESQSLARPTWFLRNKGQCNL